MNSIYLQNFTDREQMEQSFQTTIPEDAKILLAWYGYGDYSGSTFVLFMQDGKLYEVNGSHCSCNGIEGQWDPEETSIEALEHIMNNGSKFSGDYEGGAEAEIELRKVLEILKKEATLEPAKRYGKEISKLIRKYEPSK